MYNFAGISEFLDNTDDAIYYVQIINESHGSYPVAILDVTETHGPGRKEAEYLICFQDIGIFVDSEGRRSRAGDVLWSQVPVAFGKGLFISRFTLHVFRDTYENVVTFRVSSSIFVHNSLCIS